MMFPKKTYKKRKPSLASRGKFSHKTIAEILVRDNDSCVVCFKQADDIHHCKFKSQGGRGVFTNGVAICRSCHNEAHSCFNAAEKLRNMMIGKYGENYYKDEYDC